MFWKITSTHLFAHRYLAGAGIHFFYSNEVKSNMY